MHSQEKVLVTKLATPASLSRPWAAFLFHKLLANFSRIGILVPMAELMLQRKEDLNWLLNTLLAGRTDIPVKFRCAVLEGNTDCPSSIALYADPNPYIAPEPLAIYEIDEDMNYTRKV